MGEEIGASVSVVSVVPAVSEVSVMSVVSLVSVVSVVSKKEDILFPGLPDGFIFGEKKEEMMGFDLGRDSDLDLDLETDLDSHSLCTREEKMLRLSNVKILVLEGVCTIGAFSPFFLPGSSEERKDEDEDEGEDEGEDEE